MEKSVSGPDADAAKALARLIQGQQIGGAIIVTFVVLTSVSHFEIPAPRADEKLKPVSVHVLKLGTDRDGDFEVCRCEAWGPPARRIERRPSAFNSHFRGIAGVNL